MTERLYFHFSLSCIGEGNCSPLQCSCLENPRDRGAWWAAVCGVAQSQTRLKRLSSRSSSLGSLKSFLSYASRLCETNIPCFHILPGDEQDELKKGLCGIYANTRGKKDSGRIHSGREVKEEPTVSLIILYWNEIISVKQDLKDEKKRQQDLSQKGDCKAKGPNWISGWQFLS